MLRTFFVFTLALFTASCSHQSSETWENMKTASRYMQKGVDTLLGKDHDSKMLASEEDFYGPEGEDFIPLSTSDLKRQLSDGATPQARIEPGQFGVPTLDKFYAAPRTLETLFASIHFETDQHTVKSKDELSALINLAKYLKDHKNVYLRIDGHCDERASAGYNMALGMRRANSVRNFLVKHGADSDRIYTISRGKEQPVALGHTPDDWKMNRRSEFRVFEK